MDNSKIRRLNKVIFVLFIFLSTSLSAFAGQGAIYKVTVLKHGYLDLAKVYNTYALSVNGEKYPPDFDSHYGRTIDAENLPRILSCPRNPKITFMYPWLNHIRHWYDVGSHHSAIKTQGQVLNIIPQSVFHSIHFLACSISDRDEKGKFILEYKGGAKEEVVIDISDWINRKRGHEAVYRDPERHFSNGTESFNYNRPIWLFHYKVNLKGKVLTKIILPTNDKIRIFAITLR